jgi:hypothetical protein
LVSDEDEISSWSLHARDAYKPHRFHQRRLSILDSTPAALFVIINGQIVIEAQGIGAKPGRFSVGPSQELSGSSAGRSPFVNE